MRLPRPEAPWSDRVSYGRYLYTRLLRAKLLELAERVKGATAAVKAAGRAVEDAEEPVQDALANRDGVDDDLDDGAQGSRLNLASRGVGADKSAPYTSVFHKGIEYYTAATIAENADRYSELGKRMTEHLPAGDPLLASVPVIEQNVVAFTSAVKSVAAARTEKGLAVTRLESAVEQWDLLVEKTYGALVEKFGKKKAERFFPRSKRAGGEDPVVPPPAA